MNIKIRVGEVELEYSELVRENDRTEFTNGYAIKNVGDEMRCDTLLKTIKELMDKAAEIDRGRMV